MKKPGDPLVERHIFEDNLNWAAFSLAEKDNLRDVEIKEVNKMLSCKDESRGFFTFDVPHRHAVLTIPAALWLIVRRNRFLQKVLMDGAIVAINDTISYKHRNGRLTAGAVVNESLPTLCEKHGNIRYLQKNPESQTNEG